MQSFLFNVFSKLNDTDFIFYMFIVLSKIAEQFKSESCLFGLAVIPKVPAFSLA